jgi:pyridoxal phosphate enzyme (YggS family)
VATLRGAAVISASTVAGRVAEARLRVEAAGRDPKLVTIVAVTKGFGPDAVEAAAGAGLVDVGENYAQELLDKAGRFTGRGLRWHFLGPVQRNKVRRLADRVAVWEAIDRPAAAQAVAAAEPGAEVFVEVNVDGAPGRPGCGPELVDALVDEVRRLPLRARGLMAVAPPGGGDEARRCFRWLARTARRLGLEELSMGMSDDFEEAVAEGATTVRLGRFLFGPRPEPARARR